jgi:hypothetical protein
LAFSWSVGSTLFIESSCEERGYLPAIALRSLYR